MNRPTSRQVQLWNAVGEAPSLLARVEEAIAREHAGERVPGFVHVQAEEIRLRLLSCPNRCGDALNRVAVCDGCDGFLFFNGWPQP